MKEYAWAASTIAPRPYYSKLLKSARQFISEGEYAVAVILSFMACEVLSEQVFVELRTSSQTVAQANIRSDGFLSYNLANDNVRRRYVSLSGDNIHEQPFWREFQALSKLRNGVVHGAHRTVSAEEASFAYSVTAAFVTHLIRAIYGFRVQVPPIAT